MLPQQPLVELGIIDLQSPVASSIYNLQASLVMASYFCIQVTMAIDQFIAVFWPFKHARLRRNLNRVALVFGAFVVMLFTAANGFAMFGYDHNPFGAMIIILSMVTLATLLFVYPATAYKLYRQNATVRPQPQTRLETSGKCSDNAVKSNKARLHVQALKIYTTILLQFLLAYIASVALIVIFGQLWMGYFIYINHTCNPIIYYCFVPKFREGVKTSARALCRQQ